MQSDRGITLHCENCLKCNDNKFQKAFELKKTGLQIFKYVCQDIEQRTSIGQRQPAKKDYIILDNPSEKELRRPDFVNELCQYKTRCMYCTMLIKRLLMLLEAIDKINKREVIGVCDRCRTRNKAVCTNCEYLIEKYLTEKKALEQENLFRQWLSEFQHFLDPDTTDDVDTDYTAPSKRTWCSKDIPICRRFLPDLETPFISEYPQEQLITEKILKHQWKPLLKSRPWQSAKDKSSSFREPPQQEPCDFKTEREWAELYASLKKQRQIRHEHSPNSMFSYDQTPTHVSRSPKKDISRKYEDNKQKQQYKLPSIISGASRMKERKLLVKKVKASRSPPKKVHYSPENRKDKRTPTKAGQSPVRKAKGYLLPQNKREISPAKSRQSDRKAKSSLPRKNRQISDKITSRSPTTKDQQSPDRKSKGSPPTKDRPSPDRKAKVSPPTKRRPSPDRKAKVSPPTKRRPSPDRKAKGSPPTKKRPSPERKAKSIPPTKDRPSPDRKAIGSPPTKDRQSPHRKPKRSPPTKDRQSPDSKAKGRPPSKVGQSPVRKVQSISPTKLRRSPDRKLKDSPPTKDRHSPDRKVKSASPTTYRRSPDRKPKHSPPSKESRTPDKKNKIKSKESHPKPKVTPPAVTKTINELSDNDSDSSSSLRVLHEPDNLDEGTPTTKKHVQSKKNDILKRSPVKERKRKGTSKSQSAKDDDSKKDVSRQKDDLTLLEKNAKAKRKKEKSNALNTLKQQAAKRLRKEKRRVGKEGVYLGGIAEFFEKRKLEVNDDSPPEDLDETTKKPEGDKLNLHGTSKENVSNKVLKSIMAKKRKPYEKKKNLVIKIIESAAQKNKQHKNLHKIDVKLETKIYEAFVVRITKIKLAKQKKQARIDKKTGRFKRDRKRAAKDSKKISDSEADLKRDKNNIHIELGEEENSTVLSDIAISVDSDPGMLPVICTEKKMPNVKIIGDRIIRLKSNTKVPIAVYQSLSFQSQSASDVYCNQPLIYWQNPLSEFETPVLDATYFQYELSNPKWIQNGLTVLPEKVTVKEICLYEMVPLHGDWFKNHKNENLFYNTGEKLGNIDSDGNAKMFYKNGKVALIHRVDKDERIRLVIYSSGEGPCKFKRKKIRRLAVFDHIGSGIVFDAIGRPRLKYNQAEGQKIDPDIRGNRNWQFHSLNRRKIVKTIYEETIESLRSNDDLLLPRRRAKLDDETTEKSDKEIMLAIEKENKLKTLKTKEYDILNCEIGPFRINEHFVLHIVNQRNIKLRFDANAGFHMNLGMHMNSTSLIGYLLGKETEVVTPLDAHINVQYY